MDRHGYYDARDEGEQIERGPLNQEQVLELHRFKALAEASTTVRHHKSLSGITFRTTVRFYPEVKVARAVTPQDSYHWPVVDLAPVP